MEKNMPLHPQTLQEELQHFNECQNIISQNITRYQEEWNHRHEQVQELYKAIKTGDPELYNQLMAATSLEDQAANGLLKNSAALKKPFFGRIDYLDKAIDRTEQVYIGKNGVFRDKVNVLIADWRAPISGVYYENELGPGEYGLSDESRCPIHLYLKRTYDVADGELKGFYDSDVASNDELLVKYLSQNKDVVLGEIIATIQKEQNAIIRETPFANIIVQGVAGSGKTTVAMHRISYLLYNYKERFASNEFCIIGSNDLLLNYITGGLPELDVPNIKHLRMDQLLIHLCEKEWNKKASLVPLKNDAKYRCSMEFMRELEAFLQRKRDEIIPRGTLKDLKLGTILSASSTATLLKEHPEYSVARLLTTLDDRVKTRVNFLLSGHDKYIIQKVLKKYAGFYKRKLPKVSIFQLYQEFLYSRQATQKPIITEPNRIVQESTESKSTERQSTKYHITEQEINEHILSCSQYKYDLCDLAALALIHYRITQKAPNEEFGLLFLDEAQDFGFSIFYVLKTLLPKAFFTIMGDVSQNINYDTGINDWEELSGFFLDNENDKFLTLQKSYRNTIEISEYAGKILDAASSGKYKISPVIRHGLPVVEEEFWSDIDLAERIKELIPQIRAKGYGTTAIICMSEEESRQARELLQDSVELVDGNTNNYSAGTMILPIHLVKGLEFDTVILWNPRIKQNLAAPDKTKLLYVAVTRALHELYVFSC